MDGEGAGRDAGVPVPPGRPRHARRHLVAGALVLLALLAPHVGGAGPRVDEATTLAPAAAAAPEHPAGSPRWALYEGTLPDGRTTWLRWDPCSTVTYRVTLTGVPTRLRAQVLAETQDAVAEVAQRTGLRLVYRGVSGEVPLTRPRDPFDQSADLLVAWVRPDQADVDLSGGTAGRAGARGMLTSRVSDDVTWEPGATELGHVILRGYVVLDAPQLLAEGKPAAGPGTSRRNTLLHELAHAVGVGHAEDPTQLMHPRLHAGTPDGFADGDLEALEWVGSAHGCLSPPQGVPDLQ
ncbi:hypothetical protein [Aquipuribacter sp. SD81]|uniref:hypothetical protein n=1 Tax=Aquipuribacter sp. SD81 TaxID=3127703 RepID=UPI00301AF748